ncbi:MAG: sigma-70 family RNA polymerase sigma factor [Cyclobacteriaceae bacterium]|nr:sigma-70 family RNA polymerase sigma factor [Cyclobacteriaceae bacterium]
MTDPEFELIDRIIAGNQTVYAELVDRHKSYAFTIAYKVLENRSDAEEAAQDAFVKAYHHLKSFKRDAKFSTWLYRIVFNTAVSYKRKQKVKFQDIETTVVEYGQEAEGILERSDKKKYIQQAMNKLNEVDKLVISLFYLEEFSLEEIAEITGMLVNTVKVRVHRARLRLADELTILLKKEALTL